MDPLVTEQNAVSTMLDQGISFTVPLRGALGMLGAKVKFRIRQPYLGTLMHISKAYVQLKIDEKVLQDDTIKQGFLVVGTNVHNISDLVTLAILNSSFKIRLFRRPLRRWLMWHLTPDNLFILLMYVISMSNVQSFLNSIRLAEAMRVTKPKAEMSREDTGV